MASGTSKPESACACPDAALSQENCDSKRKHSILIVDDDQAMRRFLRRALENEYEVVEAPCARRALELALRCEPACILLDLVLPGLSGLELCQIFSTLRFTRGIPVVILTGEPADQYRELCLALGATEYFEKPVDPLQLAAFLARLLNHRPKERRAEDRAQLRLILKLRGADANGTQFETVTTTDEVSTTGFVCGCTPSLDDNAVVEVFFWSPLEQPIGRARVARRERMDRHWKRYAFQFLGEPRSWLPLNLDSGAADAARPGEPPESGRSGAIHDDGSFWKRP